MSKYVLLAPSHKLMTSGKVREDIVKISEGIGYEKLPIEEVLTKEFVSDDVVLFPFPSEKGSEKIDQQRMENIKKSGAKVIIITLNIDYLRYEDAPKEPIIDSLNASNFIISLTEQLSNRLKSDGVKVPMSELGLHDYLVPEPIHEASYEKTVIFAGSPYKAPYVADWPNEVKLNVFSRENDIDLDTVAKNSLVNYIGYINPNEMPKLLSYGFGLAFDADSKAGDFAEYQMLNLSHKVSMFLAAGIPLIVNSKAAVAKMLNEAGAGILIDDISEIDEKISELSKKEYDELAKKSNEIGKQVRSGFFYKKSIELAEQSVRL